MNLDSDRFHVYQIEICQVRNSRRGRGRRAVKICAWCASALLQRLAQYTHVRHADGFPACAGQRLVLLLGQHNYNGRIAGLAISNRRKPRVYLAQIAAGFWIHPAIFGGSIPVVF